MSKYYITEAFKEFNILDEAAEEFALNPESLDDMVSFIDRVGDDDDDIEIYDLQAQAEDELQDSYNGKVILQCKVCKSDVFEDKDNIEINEDGLVNVATECPFCQSNDGYNIIGQISPFKAGMEFEEPEVEEPADVEEPVEVEAEEIELEPAEEDDKAVEEGLKMMPFSKRRKDESLRKSLKESIEDADDAVIQKITDWVEDRILDAINLQQLEIDCPEYNGDWFDDDGHVWDEEVQPHLNKFVYEVVKLLFENCGEDGMNEALSMEHVDELDGDEAIEGVDAVDGIDELKDNEEVRGSLDEACEKVDEECEDCEESPLDESIESASIETDDESMTMTTKEDGGVVIETSPKESEVTSDEVIAPIDDMEQDEIIDDALAKDEEDNFDDLGLDEPIDELDMEEEELPFDEFDEESFDGLGESYLRRCYENVNGFKTTDVSCKGNNLVVEGIITFDSGNQKKTKFVFESVKNKNGKVRFTGLNEQISRGKKSFKLNCSLDNTKLVCESLNYNYKSKNDLNESVRVYGTVRK